MPAEQKTNYEILEANKKSVLEFASGVEIKPAPGIDVIKEGYRGVGDLLKKHDFSNAIKKLDEIKDNKIGINWHESEDLGNGTKALIRDARNVTESEPDLKIDASEKYGMQILNEVRAGMSLIDQAGLDAEESKVAEQKLMHIATKAIEELGALGSESIKSYNTQIIHVLDEANIPYKHTVDGVEKEISSAEQLNFAKEITSLNDEHRHIVTLNSVQDKYGTDHTIVEADIMLNGLTNAQKQQYDDIADSEKGKPCRVEWFDNMPEHKQNLLRNVAPEIASGKKIIPTQLLSDVAGVRNAYQKVTAIKSPEKETKILLESLHCGAPASKIKVIDKEKVQGVVNENIQQLKSYTKEGQAINLNTLNSKTPLDTRGEDFIIEQVVKGVENGSAKDSTTTSPINRWRLLGGGRDTKVFQDNLKQIGEAIEKTSPVRDQNFTVTHSTENVAKYLKNGASVFDKIADFIPFDFIKSTKVKAKEELKKIDEYYELDDKNPHSNFIKDMKVAMKARSLLDTPILLSQSENVNLEATSLMTYLQNSINNRDLGEKLNIKDSTINVNFCKSGKDRTGYVEMIQSTQAALDHLEIDARSDGGKAILKKLASGGHTQEMAGIQGGTIGCHSIKTNLEFGLNKEHEAAQGILNQKSAKFNSKIKVVAKEEKFGIIEEFEKTFAKSDKYPTRAESKHKDAPEASKAKQAEESKSQNIYKSAKLLKVPAQNIAEKKNTAKHQPPQSASHRTPPIRITEKNKGMGKG